MSVFLRGALLVLYISIFPQPFLQERRPLCVFQAILCPALSCGLPVVQGRSQGAILFCCLSRLVVPLVWASSTETVLQRLLAPVFFLFMAGLEPQEPAQPSIKRRRLSVKQPSPHGVNDRATRNQTQTFIRDRWVADRMTAEGSHGQTRRHELRVAFSTLETKATVLASFWPDIPEHWQQAALALWQQWSATATDPVEAEHPSKSYRGSGTMFRFSGAWSHISSAEAEQLLQGQYAETVVDAVCDILHVDPTVMALWADFKSFSIALATDFHFERLSIALELHTKSSFERKAPAVHFHLMFDASPLA